jgi:hypothetical protein
MESQARCFPVPRRHNSRKPLLLHVTHNLHKRQQSILPVGDIPNVGNAADNFARRNAEGRQLLTQEIKRAVATEYAVLRDPYLPLDDDVWFWDIMDERLVLSSLHEYLVFKNTNPREPDFVERAYQGLRQRFRTPS